MLSVGPHSPVQFGQSWRGYTLFQVIQKLGLTNGLKLCLDAGDAASYTSGQSWLDRSGNGYDFFLGANDSATATDPTFNGTAGRLSSGEYWSFDGGDYFRLDEANPAWVNNLHKAGTHGTMICAIKPAALFKRVWGTRGALAGNTGSLFSVNPDNEQVGWFAYNAGSEAANFTGNPAAINTTTWNICGVSFQEGVSSASFLFANGVSTTPATLTYSSPSSGNASFSAEIGTVGNGVFPFEAGTQLAMFAAWEGVALSRGQVAAVWNAIRGRFSI